MINHSAILNAIKAIYDNDKTMKELLKRGSDSKVFTGMMPNQFIRPALQIVIMTDEQRDTTHDLSELTLYINAHTVNNVSGLQDQAESSAIVARANALIDDVELTVSGHAFCKIHVEGRNPCVSNPAEPDKSIEGLRCRMYAV